MEGGGRGGSIGRDGRGGSIGRIGRIGEREIEENIIILYYIIIKSLYFIKFKY